MRTRANRSKVAQLTGFTMPAWPLRSVALITSAGTQEGANARVPWLLRCKAAVRGASCEPMTGHVDFTEWLYPQAAPRSDEITRHALDWVIVGGESGDMDARREEMRPRPCEQPWLENVVQQCSAAGVPCFVKQLGNVLAAKLGREGKGGALEDLPEHLRVRQFPRMPAP